MRHPLCAARAHAPARNFRSIAAVAAVAACWPFGGAGAQSAPRPGSPGASVDWTLDATLAAAATGNPMIAEAQARLRGARGSRITAGAFSNPVATWQVENVGFPGRAAPDGAGIVRESATFLTVPLEPLYQRWSRVSRGDEDVRSAAAGVTVAERRVARDAAHAFFDLAEAQTVLEEAETVRGSLERLAAWNRSRVREGVAAEGDLLRVEVELARAATAEVLSHVAVARARAELRPYLGGTSAAGMIGDSLRAVVPSGGSPSTVSVADLGALLMQARDRRPELLAARAHAASTSAAVGLQRTLTLRQLGAVIGNKYIGTQNSMVAGLSMPIPIFDQNRGEILKATGDRDAAAQEVTWAERVVDAEVRAAYESADRLTRQLSVLQPRFLMQADDARRVTQTSYEEGAASLLQLLDAIRAHGDARLTWFHLLYAQRESLIDLAVATGVEPTSLLPKTKP